MNFSKIKILSVIKNNKLLIKNFSYLSILQVFNMLLPLITYPYLIRVLGKEVYGLLVFSQAVISYFAKFINYGFNISATKDISINRNNKSKVSEIFSSVLILKGFIFILAFLVLLVILKTFPALNKNFLLYILTFHVCLYEFVFPLWFFQGIEQMKYIAIINFISRYSFLALIFILVKNQDDYLLVPMINGMGSLLAGILSLFVVIKINKINFVFPSMSALILNLKEGFPFFISSLSTQLYTNANKLFIGAFLTMEKVAMYDIAEKIFSIVRIPITLLGQTIYPQNVREKNTIFIKKIFKMTIIIISIVYLLIFIFSNKIVIFLGGYQMAESSTIVRLLLFSIIPVAAGQFYCTQTLIPFGYKKQYTYILVQASILYFILIGVVFLFKFINIYSFAIVSILVQSYITVYSYYLIKYKFKLW